MTGRENIRAREREREGVSEERSEKEIVTGY